MDGLPVDFARLVPYLMVAGMTLVAGGQATYLAVRGAPNPKLVTLAVCLGALLGWLLLTSGIAHAPIDPTWTDWQYRVQSALAACFFATLAEFVRREVGAPNTIWSRALMAALAATAVASLLDARGCYTGSIDLEALAAVRRGEPPGRPVFATDPGVVAACALTLAAAGSIAAWSWRLRARRDRPLFWTLMVIAGAAAVDFATLAVGGDVPISFTVMALAPLLVVISYRVAESAARRGEAEGEAASSGERLNAVLESISDPIVVADRLGRVERLNRAAAALLGDPERWLGSALSTLIPKEASAAATGEPGPGRRLELRGASGPQPVAVSATALHDAEHAPAGTVVVLRPLAAELEHEELRRRMRDAALVAQTAAGAARELIPLLAGMRGNLQRLAGAPSDRPARAGLEATARAAAAAAQLAARLAALDRGAGARARVAVAELLARAAAVARELGAAALEVTCAAADDLPEVVADPIALESVVVELVAHAVRAMPGGGRLVLSGAATEPPPGQRWAVLPAPGRYVELSVSDTAEAIPPDLQARLLGGWLELDSTQRGAGLGLALASTLARAHGGGLALTSTAPGEAGPPGNRVALYLPVALPAAPDAAAVPLLPATAGRILVLDPGVGIRRVLRDLLENASYRVVEAATVAEAVDEARHGTVDAVVAGARALGSAPREAIESLQRAAPALRLVLRVDAVMAEQMPDLWELSGLDVLYEPLDPRALLAALGRGRRAWTTVVTP